MCGGWGLDPEGTVMSLELDLEDLGLDLSPVQAHGPGRTAKPLKVEFSHELTREELSKPPVKVQTSPSLKKIRDTHHALARVLANGMSETEASLVTGYSLSRISILKADPQFASLLEFYRNETIEGQADFRARMVNVGLDALQELAERLEDNPEDFSPALLKDIVKDMADRTGHAPQRGPTNVTQINVGLSDRMARARERAASVLGASNGNAIPVVIEHE